MQAGWRACRLCAQSESRVRCEGWSMGWWKAMYVCVGCNNQDRNQQIATANRPLLLTQTQPPEPNRHGSYIVSTE